MSDSGTRQLTLLAGGDERSVSELADVVTLQDRQSAQCDDGDEVAFFHDTVAEYSWARDVAGLAPTTLHRMVMPVLEVCRHYDCVPWRLTPRQLDQYFAGRSGFSPSTAWSPHTATTSP